VNLSVVVIGKNSQKTLRDCIIYLNNAIENSVCINKFEIIYVDSNSSDRSVHIANELKIITIEIVDGYTTASLGRYLGKKYAQYENLIFLDSDMFLDKYWFDKSLKSYEKYGAVIGERHEKLYKDDALVKEVPKFYNIKKVEVTLNIGGFLMIKKNIIEDINYTPIIRNEEEKDFYAKFYDQAKIYKIPVLAYIHNNSNLTNSRIKDYLDPYAKNGYILSLINSISKGYFKNYFILQRKYLISILVSSICYIVIISGSFLGVASLLILLFNGKKQLKGSLMTALFFPYKLIMSLIFLSKNRSTKYIYKNKVYVEAIRLLKK